MSITEIYSIDNEQDTEILNNNTQLVNAVSTAEAVHTTNLQAKSAANLARQDAITAEANALTSVNQKNQLFEEATQTYNDLYISFGLDPVGIVKVFTWGGSSWSQLGNDRNGFEAHSLFGTSVAISSSNAHKIVVGSPYEDGTFKNNCGKVRILEKFSSNNWGEYGTGATIEGEETGELFGSSVAIDSSAVRIVAGAPFNNKYARKAGAVRVYSRSGTTWTQTGNTIYGKAYNSRLGHSVSISSDGSKIAVSALYGGINEQGYVATYRLASNNNWIQIGYKMHGYKTLDTFGNSVSMSRNGKVIASSASFESGRVGSTYESYVRVFKEPLGEIVYTGEGYKVGDIIGGPNKIHYNVTAVSYTHLTLPTKA